MRVPIKPRKPREASALPTAALSHHSLLSPTPASTLPLWALISAQKFTAFLLHVYIVPCVQIFRLKYTNYSIYKSGNRHARPTHQTAVCTGVTDMNQGLTVLLLTGLSRVWCGVLDGRVIGVMLNQIQWHNSTLGDAVFEKALNHRRGGHSMEHYRLH